MLQQIRQILASILLIGLPFHALFVTVMTRVLVGQNHAPLTLLALWKEAVIALILLITVVEIVRSKQQWRVDALDLCIIGLCVIAGLLFSMHLPATFHQFALGVKYDLLSLIIFLLARRVVWSNLWLRRMLLATIIIGCVIAAYGLLTLVLPASFFRLLGYSDMHSLYIPDGPLASFQYIQNTALRRMQSTMSGPNQLGLWMLLPLSIVVAWLFSHRAHRGLLAGALVVIGIAIFFTYSRTAWLAAALIIVVGVLRNISSRRIIPFVIGICTSIFVFSVLAIIFVPAISIRMGSSRGHFLLPLYALQTIVAHPQGIGIGTVGPASNATSEACVMLQPEDDPSWAKDQPDLCVFLGDKQVQPTNRTCNCPFLTENWYLQIGVEMGVLGLALFLTLILIILSRLRKSESWALLMLLGISFSAILLHAWEDAAIAYCVWLFLSCVDRVHYDNANRKAAGS
ncbi:MAG: hypothetical protein KBD00_03325 [Candidatus Peribacteraceae bacterium]|nr:hypothetical protein [Candidatus Peribacteraceae bacterium]